MAYKGTDLERHIILNEYWRLEAESQAMEKAARQFMDCGLLGEERTALRLTASLFSEQEQLKSALRQKANA
jgi:hypothetical protein